VKKNEISVVTSPANPSGKSDERNHQSMKKLGYIIASPAEFLIHQRFGKVDTRGAASASSACR
jgi:hypothetical protein